MYTPPNEWNRAGRTRVHAAAPIPSIGVGTSTDRRTARLRFGGILAAAVALLLGTGCAHQKPFMYPNATSQSRSQAAIERDIAACHQLAEANGLDYDDGRIARRTVEGGVVGGASGAAVGAIFGDAGRGAAAGAAHGATQGLFRGLFASDEPHPLYRRFVEQCLRDQGYRPIGWR